MRCFLNYLDRDRDRYFTYIHTKTKLKTILVNYHFYETIKDVFCIIIEEITKLILNN